MSTKYDDRDRERNQRNYGRRSGQDYDRSYGQSGQGSWGSAFDDDDQRYAGESRWRGQQYGTGRAMYRGGGDYESPDWGSKGWQDDRDYASERNRNYGRESDRRYLRYGDDYGSSYGGGYERGEGRYRNMQGGYSQRSSYPGGYRSGESYRERERNYGDYDRRGYGERRGYGDRAGYEDRGGYGEGEERGWWDRLSDTVASWFGDEEAERRRRMERPYQGRGPKGYRRSDERIREDVNDRLSDGYLDATEIEVSVTGGEVVLSGTVDTRTDKRRAEDIADHVSGVTNVENRLRVRNRYQTGAYGTSEGAATTSTGAASMGSAAGTGTSSSGVGTTGTTGTGSSSSTGTSSGSARGRSAGS